MNSIAVIDASEGTLTIYEVPVNYDSTQTEAFLSQKGHHIGDCSWGGFDGTINDERWEETCL